jgi:hypothetical protein
MQWQTYVTFKNTCKEQIGSLLEFQFSRCYYVITCCIWTPPVLFFWGDLVAFMFGTNIVMYFFYSKGKRRSRMHHINWTIILKPHRTCYTLWRPRNSCLLYFMQAAELGQIYWGSARRRSQSSCVAYMQKCCFFVQKCDYLRKGELPFVLEKFISLVIYYYYYVHLLAILWRTHIVLYMKFLLSILPQLFPQIY